MDPTDITVKNVNREVALSGTVPSYRQYLAAAVAARRVAGVSRVHKPLGGAAARGALPRRRAADHGGEQRAGAGRQRAGGVEATGRDGNLTLSGGGAVRRVAVLELIADAGAETPIVLIVDDLHWVDSASRDAIEFVARRVEAEPAVIFLATRPTGRGTWSGEQGVASFRLGGLDPAASRALLQKHSPRLPAADVQRVLAAAAGNPLALTKLPLALGSATATTRRLGASVPLTARLERSFAVPARDLDSATRTLLLVAALQDSDRLAETLSATTVLTGGQPEGVSLGIDTATTAGLLSIDGASFRLHHPLVRPAIARSATPDQRSAVHEAFAHTLPAIRIARPGIAR